MFNNNLRKMVASAMLLTVLTGTSLAIKVPAHAQSQSHIYSVAPSSVAQIQINESKANSYFKSALINIHDKDKSKAQDDLITSFNYANEISNESSTQLIGNILKVQNQLSMSLVYNS